jgi:hypothetical protein
MRNIPLCKKTCLLVLFLLFYHRHRHASFHSYDAARTMWHNDQFGMEAAAPMAPMLTRMLIVTLLEGYCQCPGTKPYVFLSRSEPTTNPQRPSTRHDLNGGQRLPWCLTPSVDADNSHPECWWIFICGGAGSGAPWQPLEDGGHHGRQGTV